MPFVSSSKKIRDHARSELPNFIEVYVKCPVEVCMERDPKELYKRARDGKESHIVGIDIPYEESEAPELVIETHRENIDQCIEKILAKIKESHGFLLAEKLD